MGSHDHKFKHRVLQIIAFVETLIAAILLMKILLYMINLEQYYFIAYFAGFGIVYVFLAHYYSKFSIHNKSIYIVSVMLLIVILYNIILVLG